MEPIPRQPGSTALTSRTRPDAFFKNYRTIEKNTHLIVVSTVVSRSLIVWFSTVTEIELDVHIISI